MTGHPTSSLTLPLGLRRSDLLVAAATGLFTIPDPARRSPLGRFGLRSLIAGTTAAAVWMGFGEDDQEHDVAPRVALTAGSAGLVYGVAELGEAMDRALQRRLLRMGLRRPRVVMAVGGTALSLALSVLERRFEESADDSGPTAARPSYRELPVPVRELVSAILEQTEDHDSLRLRAQLARARQETWGEETAPRVVELSVPEDAPLAVPHRFTFPVSARFTSARGVPCTVQLLVDGGRLAAVVVDVEHETWAEVVEAWDPGEDDADPLAEVALPAVRDVTFVTEAAGRP